MIKIYKNPFNYIGAKYKLLGQIYPLFPKDCDTIIDLFGGSGEVGLNSNYKRIIYNEKCKPLVNIFNNLNGNFVEEVEKCIAEWKLHKLGKEEFLNLREYYNNNLKDKLNRENAIVLYCLLTHAFNYQIAFNSKGEYNMPSGYNRSWFSPQLKQKLTDYIEIIKTKQIFFRTNDFNSLNIEGVKDNMFVYCDHLI